MRHSKTRYMRASVAGRFAFVAVLSASLAILTGVEPALASSYAGVIDAASPTVFMPYEAPNGGTSVDVPHGNTCTLSGGSFTGTTLVLGGGGSLTGATNGCYYPSGNGSALSSNGLTTFSLEYWFATTTTNSSMFASAWGDSPSSTHVACILNNGASNRTIRCDPGGFDCAAPAALNNGAPHYVASVYDGSKHHIYIDGVQPATGNNNGPCEANFSSSIGTVCHVGVQATYNNNQPTCSTANNAFCNGGSTPCWCCNTLLDASSSVGEIAYYSYGLTAQNVTDHYGGRNGGPAKQFVIVPTPEAVKVGGHWHYNAQATDSGGADVSAQTTFTSDALIITTGAHAGTVTCDGHAIDLSTASSSGFVTLNWNWSSPSIDCVSNVAGQFSIEATASTTGPNYHVQAQVTVGAPPSQFSVVGINGSDQNQQAIIGQKIALHNVSSVISNQGTFTDVSATDSWTFTTVPNHVTCTTPILGGNPLSGGLRYFATCQADTNGTYTLTATDSYGFTANVYLVIGTVTTATTCGATDLGCWLNQIWDALQQLAGIPYQIVQGIYNALFVSQTGGASFIDLSPLTSNLWPTGNCRNGQTPTASDNVHCYAFPFSIPSDLGAVLNMVNATPSAPTMALNWDFPLWTGTTLHESQTIDPTVVLTSQTMVYVRGAELVLFIIGCAMGTWRILQLVGVD